MRNTYELSAPDVYNVTVVCGDGFYPFTVPAESEHDAAKRILYHMFDQNVSQTVEDVQKIRDNIEQIIVKKLPTLDDSVDVTIM